MVNNPKTGSPPQARGPDAGVSPGSFDGVRDGRYRRDLAVGRGTGEGPLTTEPQTVRAGTENGWNPFGTVLAPALKLDVDLDCHGREVNDEI